VLLCKYSQWQTSESISKNEALNEDYYVHVCLWQQSYRLLMHIRERCSSYIISKISNYQHQICSVVLLWTKNCKYWILIESFYQKLLDVSSVCFLISQADLYCEFISPPDITKKSISALGLNVKYCARIDCPIRSQIALSIKEKPYTLKNEEKVIGNCIKITCDYLQ